MPDISAVAAIVVAVMLVRAELWLDLRMSIDRLYIWTYTVIGRRMWVCQPCIYICAYVAFICTCAHGGVSVCMCVYRVLYV